MGVSWWDAACPAAAPRMSPAATARTDRDRCGVIARPHDRRVLIPIEAAAKRPNRWWLVMAENGIALHNGLQMLAGSSPAGPGAFLSGWAARVAKP